MRAEDIVARLTKVRKTSVSSWTACCPAHPDKNPSMSIRETGDGIILIHCFAQCKKSDIDPDDRESVARAFGVAGALAAEIMWENDERAADEWNYLTVEICGPVRKGWPDFGRHKKQVRVRNDRAAAIRWQYMRRWVDDQIIK